MCVSVHQTAGRRAKQVQKLLFTTVGPPAPKPTAPSSANSRPTSPPTPHPRCRVLYECVRCARLHTRAHKLPATKRRTPMPADAKRLMCVCVCVCWNSHIRCVLCKKNKITDNSTMTGGGGDGGGGMGADEGTSVRKMFDRKLGICRAYSKWN